MPSAEHNRGPERQQVMIAQPTSATSPSVEQHGARLEGEVNGPDYARPQLPNGVERSTRASNSPAGIDSLPYSPTALHGSREATAFLAEAWPAQPQTEGSGQGAARNMGDVPAALRWMHRLGEFFRQHTAMETLTTVTRQQFAAPSGTGFMMQHQVQHSSPTTPHNEPTGVGAEMSAATLEGNPPLFGRMREGRWRLGLRRLRCCMGFTELDRSVVKFRMPFEHSNRGYKTVILLQVVEYLGVIGLILRKVYMRMLGLLLQVLEYLGVIGLMLRKVYLRMLGLLLQVLEYLGVIGLMLRKVYLRMLGLLLQVMAYLERIGLIRVKVYLRMLGLLLQVMAYLEEIGLIRIKVYLRMLGLLLQVMEYLGVIGLILRPSNVVTTAQSVLRCLMMVGLLLQVVEYLEVIGSLSALKRSRKVVCCRRSWLAIVAPQCLSRMSRVVHVLSYGVISVVYVCLQEVKEAPKAVEQKVVVRGWTGPRGVLVRSHEDAVPRPARVGWDAMDQWQPMCEAVSFVAELEAYRAKPPEIEGTFGDYLGRAAPEEATARQAAPSPLDVLITGMSQLQQVLLKQRGGDAMDLEAKAVVELSKLPEYTPESGATDFQDYLYLTEQQVGSLASGATDWWQRTLQVAQRAYSEYQTLSPMKRLSVKAVLPDDLKEDRYKKLERKVASLLLNSLPKGVRDELVAHRVQGVHQILFRLMVVFQPGGAQDRAQLLRQLDVSESSPGPAEAVLAIRKWYRLLQRAADLNIALPDESLQVRSLSNIVKRTAEIHSDFKFRVALAKTELQIDSRPSQQNVMKFLQHLLAELEQLGAGNKKSPAPAATTGNAAMTPSAATTTTPPSLKGVQPTGDAGGGGKGKQKGGAPSAKRPCQFFSSDQGCRNGKQCGFVHSWTGLNRGERCLLCGSKHHRAKECNAGSTASPERAAPPPPPKSSGATSTTPSAASPIAPSLAKATSTTSTTTAAPAQSEAAGSGGNGNKIDATKMSEILTETNKMLKALAAQSSESATAPADPLALIQQQLDEVRRLKTMRVQEPGQGEEAEALLDSGASHPFRPPRTQEELDRARRVNVSLATGEGALLPQTAEGTLLAEGEDNAPIIPMGQLVQLLGCQIKWTQSRLTVHHPVHGRLQVRLRGNCPVLPVSQALTLIAELEQARVREFQHTVEGLQAQVRVLREQGREEWTWQRHLRAFCEEGKRTSMAGFLHRCPTFASVPAEALLGIPEDVPCGLQDGWKLLKGMPWSRAKRKAMFASTSWTVHLFSGNEKAMAAKCTSTMRSSFWSVALEGEEVMVNVDVTDSRALDLTRRDGVFKLLCWAALSGRLKAIVGGPPRQSFPTPVRPDEGHPQYQKETQLITRMMMLWYIAEEGRCKAWRQGMLRRSVVKPHVGFLLEHPDGGGRDDRLSLFASPLWRAFSMDALMGEVECVMNGTPTVLGGNLDLWHLQGAELGAALPGDPTGSMWPLELVANVTLLIHNKMNQGVKVPGYAALI
ncbi:GIP [Symbiodinium sp. CCMP2592]|nr:GIP [Symbiodinium sp. CCMP2592]